MAAPAPKFSFSRHSLLTRTALTAQEPSPALTDGAGVALFTKTSTVLTGKANYNG